MASMNFESNVCDLKEIDFQPVQAIHTTFQKAKARDWLTESQKGRYHEGVLVGNWYDRRAREFRLPDEWRSVQREHYKFISRENSGDSCLEGRRLRELNKIKIEGANYDPYLLKPDDTFDDNYTTSYDIFYRILPQSVCEPVAKKYNSRKDLWEPEQDLTRKVGNLTNWGKKERVRRIYEKIKPYVKRSIMKEDYVEYGIKDVQKTIRQATKKRSWNEVDLCHLDIDPEEPFRSHLVVK